MTAAALAAFVAAIVSPPTGLAIIALMAPLKSPLVIPAPGFNTILIAATLLGCVYRLPIDRPSLRVRAPLLLLLAFVIYVTAQQAPEMLSGYAGSDGHYVGYLFGQLLTLAVLVVAAAWVLRGRPPGPFIAAGILSALFAAILAVATFSHPATGLLGNLIGVSGVDLTRVMGPFGDPNYFGLFMATAIAAAVALIVVTRPLPLRLLLLAISIVMGVALAISLSRGALLALSAGLLGLAFSRSWRVGILSVGILAVLALVVYPLFFEWRVTADAGASSSAQAYAILAQSDGARIAAGLAGALLFASSPLFGVGFGHYPSLSGQFTGFRIESHDWYANVLAEQGIVGIVLWFSMLAAVAIMMRHASRPARTVGYAVLVTYCVGSAFLQPPDSVQTSAFAVIVIVAALVGRWSDDAEGRAVSDSGHERTAAPPAIPQPSLQLPGSPTPSAAR
jgi:O-antigen ligase